MLKSKMTYIRKDFFSVFFWHDFISLLLRNPPDGRGVFIVN